MRLAPVEVRAVGNEATDEIQSRVRRRIPRGLVPMARAIPSPKLAGYAPGLGPMAELHVRHRVVRTLAIGSTANVRRRRVLGGRNG